MQHLPLAEEISTFVETGHYDEAIEIASQTENGILTAALWACWLGRSTLLGRLLKLGLDPNITDEAGRYALYISTNNILLKGYNKRDNNTYFQDMPTFELFGRKRRMCQTVVGVWGQFEHVGLIDRQKSHTIALRCEC